MSFLIIDVDIIENGNLEDYEVKRLKLHFIMFSERLYESIQEALDDLKVPIRQSLYFVQNQIYFDLISSDNLDTIQVYNVFASSFDGTGEDIHYNFKVKILNQNNKSRFIKSVAKKDD